MKKLIYLTFLLSITIFTCNAQNTTQLQHKYDFMSCEFELFKIQSDLNNLAQNIDIKTNALQHNIYNGIYDNRLYNACVSNRNACSDNFNSLKDLYKIKEEYVLLKMSTSNFTDTEINVLRAYFSVIDSVITNVERSLEIYDVVIQMYNAKRRY